MHSSKIHPDDSFPDPYEMKWAVPANVCQETNGKRIPDYVVKSIRHYQQKYHWDCGISCVMMILPENKHKHFNENFINVCNDEGFGKSTWTIDLAYLLHRYGVVHHYCTITIGIDPGYQNEGFYDRILSKDSERVKERFSNASKHGVQVSKASLGLNDILSHVACEGPVIVLVNSELLCCNLCHGNRLVAELRACLPCPIQYQGHYIVVCGYDMNLHNVIYRNPSVKDRICVTSFSTFEKARKSYGTDEDVLLIYENR